MTCDQLDQIVTATKERYPSSGEQIAWLAIGAYCLCLRRDGNTGYDVLGRTVERLGWFVRRRQGVVVGDTVRSRLGDVAAELARLGIPHTPDKAEELKRRLCYL